MTKRIIYEKRIFKYRLQRGRLIFGLDKGEYNCFIFFFLQQ